MAVESVLQQIDNLSLQLSEAQEVARAREAELVHADCRLHLRYK